MKSLIIFARDCLYGWKSRLFLMLLFRFTENKKSNSFGLLLLCVWCVPKETSIYMRYLFEDKGLRGNELLKRFPKYCKATIYRHAKWPIDKVTTSDKRKHNKGRPRKLSIREERSIMRHLRICRTALGSFSVSRLRAMGGLSSDISLWCIRRTLNRHGYRYLHSRKKDL